MREAVKAVCEEEDFDQKREKVAELLYGVSYDELNRRKQIQVDLHAVRMKGKK